MKLKITDKVVNVRGQLGESILKAIMDSIEFCKEYRCWVNLEANNQTHLITESTDAKKLNNSWYDSGDKKDPLTKMKEAIMIAEGSVVTGIEATYSNESEEYFEADFSYQIDENKRKFDLMEVTARIKSILGEGTYASVRSMDTFPNGWSVHKTNISVKLTQLKKLRILLSRKIV